MYTISIFGHRKFFSPNTEKILYNCLKSRVEGKKVRILVGTHGAYSQMAFGVAHRLKREGYDIELNMVCTSFKEVEKEMYCDGRLLNYYRDVQSVMYDIEEVHYKRKILVSNQKMVDESDEVMIYCTNFHKEYSGTYQIMQYVKKTGKPVINLFNI